VLLFVGIVWGGEITVEQALGAPGTPFKVRAVCAAIWPIAVPAWFLIEASFWSPKKQEDIAQFRNAQIGASAALTFAGLAFGIVVGIPINTPTLKDQSQTPVAAQTLGTPQTPAAHAPTGAGKN
jgi:hypothetical protein